MKQVAQRALLFRIAHQRILSATRRRTAITLSPSVLTSCYSEPLTIRTISSSAALRIQPSALALSANVPSSAKGKEKEHDDGRLSISLKDVPGGSEGRTPLDILKGELRSKSDFGDGRSDLRMKCKSDRVPKGYNRFIAALNQNGQALPLSHPLPSSSTTTALHFIPFAALATTPDSSDPLASDRARFEAQKSIWITASHVLAAAAERYFDAEGKRAIHVKSALLEGRSGGAGYAYEMLLLDPKSVPQGVATMKNAADTAAQMLNDAAGHSTTSLDGTALASIQKHFDKLVSEAVPVQVETLSPETAEGRLRENPFALEALAAVVSDKGAQARIVRIGEYVALAPGNVPLLPSTDYVKASAILGWSAASWTPASGIAAAPAVPGSEQRLLRLRGLAFTNAAVLKSVRAAQAAAATSDHRVIGLAQELFMTSDAASPGSPFVLPHGMRIGRKVERVIRDLYDIHGYDEVHTPQLFKKALWERSGHWENYRDDMFKVQGYREEQEWLISRKEHDGHACAGHGHNASEADAESFGLKPMNCPGHCLIFSSKERSYRDLPLRLAEFGPLHRNESSGSLSGLTRVRRFHQDDAHVFCAPSQVRHEIATMLTMLSDAYRAFGFDTMELVLSTRPAQSIGSEEDWQRAEAALTGALEQSRRAWTLNAGDGAFYGPKIDCRLVDAAGRKHQTATIQLDFQLPQRFDLRYADPSGGHTRPVMIHRAILGSVERFLAILIETSKGKWPFWISPRQAIVLPVANTEGIGRHAAYARDYLALGSGPAALKARQRQVADQQTGLATLPRLTDVPLERPLQVFHVDMDDGQDTLAKMVRKAQAARYNFSLVIGEKEAQNGTVSVRVRDDYVTSETIHLSGRPALSKDMGEWKLADLRQLFEKLDRNHW